MSCRILQYSEQELFGNLCDPDIFSDCAPGHEEYWHCPEELGSGFMYMAKLRPGLLLGVGDYRMTEKVGIAFERKFKSIQLSYSVAGSMEYTLDWGDGRQDVWHFKQGSGVISYIPEFRGTAITDPGLPVNCVGLYMDPWFIADLLGEERERLPCDVRRILQGRTGSGSYRLFNATAPTNIIVHQIVGCPYRGALKRIYLESKVLELITHSLVSIAPPAQGACSSRPLLNPDDEKRVRHVREVLERDFQNPPRLLDLARSVGVSHPKLNSCFREAYGATIFEYLREVRLSRARTLLEEGRMNVTEAAFEVGYSSLSHFAKAFREHFGASPGNYVREQFRQSCA